MKYTAYLDFSIIIWFPKNVKDFYTWKFLYFISPCFSYDSAPLCIFWRTVNRNQKSKFLFDAKNDFQECSWGISTVLSQYWKQIYLNKRSFENIITGRMDFLVQSMWLKNLLVEWRQSYFWFSTMNNLALSHPLENLRHTKEGKWT